MSLNTSPLGATTLQIIPGGAAGSNGLAGSGLHHGALNAQSALGGGSQNETVNALAGLLTGMMMMSMMGGGLAGGLGATSGSALGNLLAGGLGATSGSALGNLLGGGLGSGSGLGSGLGSSSAGGGSALDQALGLDSSSYGSGTDASSGSDNDNPLQQLMKLFAEVMQNLFGDQQGTQGSSDGRQPTQGEQTAYNKGVTDALSSLMGGGLSQSSSAAGSAADNGLGGKSLQNLSGPVDFQQLGNAVGTGVGMKAGIQALNDIGTHSDSSTRSFINKGDRALAKEVGQFMDQYPEVFGKPQYQKNAGSAVKTDDKSWAQALSKPDDDGMTPASIDQFNKAKGMIKSAMAGDTGNGNLQARGAGGASLGIDAMLTGDTINNMVLGKLSAA